MSPKVVVACLSVTGIMGHVFFNMGEQAVLYRFAAAILSAVVSHQNLTWKYASFVALCFIILRKCTKERNVDKSAEGNIIDEVIKAPWLMISFYHFHAEKSRPWK